MKKTDKKPANQPRKKLSAAQRQRRREDRIRWTIGLTLMVLTLTFVAGGYMYTYRKAEFRNLLGLSQDSSDPKVAAKEKAEADKVFRKYLVKLAATNHLETEAKYSAEGSTTDATERVVYDVAARKIDDSLDMQCSTQPNHSGVRINLSGQSEGAATYFRINSLNGAYVDATGKPVNAASLAPDSRGVWYRMPASDADVTVQTQLDHGAMILPAGVLAAGHDARKVTDALISNQAFEYTANAPDKSGVYTFMVRTHKDGYTAAIAQAFPEMSSSDKAVEQLFTDANEIATIDTTLQIKADGTLVSWSTTAPDICETMLANITGTSALGGLLGERVTIKPAGSLTIQPISGSTSSDKFVQLVTPRQ